MWVIRMKTLACGPDGTKHPGKVYEVGDKEGAALAEGGFAEVISKSPAHDDKSKKVETAALPGAAETAVGAGRKK